MHTLSQHYTMALSPQHGLDRQAEPLLPSQPASAAQHNIPTTSTNYGSNGDQKIQQDLRSVFTKVSLKHEARVTSVVTEETSKTVTGRFLDFIASISPSGWLQASISDLLSSYTQESKVKGSMTKSMSWITESVCSWLSMCDGRSAKSAEASSGFQLGLDMQDETMSDTTVRGWQTAPATGPDEYGTARNDVPDYIIQYAPLVHLYSGEQFWPCDIAEHLDHTTPTLNYTAVEPQLRNSTLPDLDLLNRWQHGRFVFLTSDDDVEERPEWLEGAKNIPSSDTKSSDTIDHGEWTHPSGRTYAQDPSGITDDFENRYEIPDRLGEPALQPRRRTGKIRLEAFQKQMQMEFQQHLKKVERPNTGSPGGRSKAPAILIAVDKGRGIVDAFWFFFYSFNLGNKVFNIRFGNHVGDWEHCAIRFHHGQPKAVFFSEHNFGSAYSYAAVEKLGKRPIIYSAVGTHAMYATSGTHPYVLPLGILHDQTDKGPLWDPTFNSHTYTYDFKKDILRASNMTPEAPVGWFHFSGHWGDKTYPLNDKRQYRLAGQYHYVNGPLGPKFKNLGRRKICGGPDARPCVIKHWLDGPRTARRWKGYGEHADAFSAYIEDERSHLD